jgi:hypothetical protein
VPLENGEFIIPSESKRSASAKDKGLPYEESVPFRNIPFFRQQMLLTQRKCLYNGRRVGEYLS